MMVMVMMVMMAPACRRGEAAVVTGAPGHLSQPRPETDADDDDEDGDGDGDARGVPRPPPSARRRRHHRHQNIISRLIITIGRLIEGESIYMQ